MKLYINDVVRFEQQPAHYHTVAPFSVTVHHKALTVRERTAILDAVGNAAHKIRRMRGNNDTVPFRWEKGRRYE